MKISIILGFLILFVSCGNHTSKTVTSSTTYGSHTLIKYSDGTVSWTHPEDFKPIEDLAAHTAKAQAYIDYISTSSSSCTVECKLEKADTLLGDGWIIISSNFGAGVNYTALNLNQFTNNNDFTTSGFVTPTSGEVRIETVNKLVVIENGVFKLQDDKTIGLSIKYNITDPIVSDGVFYGAFLSNSDTFIGSGYKNSTYLEYFGGGSSSGAASKEDLGLEGLTRSDFYFSEDGGSIKDLEKISSTIESDLFESYGFSTEKSMKLAKISNQYSKLKSKRALSSKERDIFTKKILGLTFKEASEKMVEDYDALIDQAADYNEVDPEAIRELINTIL